MDISDFKEVEVKKATGIKAIFNVKKLRRTLLFMGIGALASFSWFYYTDGQHMDIISSTEVFKSITVGAFFGLFISNSPCARGQC